MTTYYSDLLKSEAVTNFLKEMKAIDDLDNEDLIMIMVDMSNVILGEDLDNELHERGITIEDYVKEHVVLPE